MLTAINDKVIVKAAAREDRVGNIIIPDSAQKVTQAGHVVSIGPGLQKRDGSIEPLDVCVGDSVIFYPHGVRSAMIDGEELLFRRCDDIWAVI